MTKMIQNTDIDELCNKLVDLKKIYDQIPFY